MRVFPRGFLNGVSLGLKNACVFALAAGALFCFASLLSHSVFDDSLNASSNEPVKNALGVAGAYASDILRQLFGTFAYAVPPVVLAGCLKFLLKSFEKTWNFSAASVAFGLAQIMVWGERHRHLRVGEPTLDGGIMGLFAEKALSKIFTAYFSAKRFDEFAILLGISGAIWVILGLGFSNESVAKAAALFKKAFEKIRDRGAKRFGFSKTGAARANAEPPLTAFSEEFGFDVDPEFDRVPPKTLPETHTEQKREKAVGETSARSSETVATRDGAHALPPIDLLDDTQSNKKFFIDDKERREQAATLMAVLEEFGVRGEITGIKSGPVVTMFELKPAAGIKTARVIGLADDIARSMSAVSARIANIPGQNAIGIELPNKKRQTVYMRDLLLNEGFKNASSALPLALGQDIVGKPIIADLAKMPHLLVAGTTGSGKSVSVNAMICSILFRLSPEECRFIMIDPKMLELSVYNDIPHLLTPVVTEPKKAIVALKWAVKEMENRYRDMSKLGVRNIDGYNQRVKEAKTNGEVMTRRVQTGFDPDTGQAVFENQVLDLKPLPFIVVVIDEMADLMLVAGKEVEAAVQRLAQMARAAGLHLIMATQRPSVDVITGTIKANFPTRISFQVTSRIDSRTILGEQGAEQLLGQGDMLYMGGAGRLTRVHGPFMKDSEVEAVVAFLKRQGEPNYIDDVTTDTEDAFAEADSAEGGDALFKQAVDFVRESKKVSTSSIQRRFQIGYNRAARIVDLMEKQGIVSEANHQGKREVLG